MLKNKQKLILDELKNLAEENYKAFNSKIIPTEQTTLGIRLPILRKIAKRIAKEDAIAFIRLDKQNIYLITHETQPLLTAVEALGEF